MKIFNIKAWFADKKETAEFAMDDFKEHCIDQWYLFLEESMWDGIKAAAFGIAWLVFTNYIFMGGLFGTLIFVVLAGAAVLYIVQPILNLIILGLRCLGVKVRYI